MFREISGSYNWAFFSFENRFYVLRFYLVFFLLSCRVLNISIFNFYSLSLQNINKTQLLTGNHLRSLKLNIFFFLHKID